MLSSVRHSSFVVNLKYTQISSHLGLAVRPSSLPLHHAVLIQAVSHSLIPLLSTPLHFSQAGLSVTQPRQLLLLFCSFVFFYTFQKLYCQAGSRQQSVQRGQFGMKWAIKAFFSLNTHAENYTPGNRKTQQDLLVQVERCL